jgi:hypothetical protein
MTKLGEAPPFNIRELNKANRKFQDNVSKLKKYPVDDPLIYKRKPPDPIHGTHLGRYRYGDIETRARHSFLRNAEKAYYRDDENPKRVMRFKRASDKAFTIWMRELERS